MVERGRGYAAYQRNPPAVPGRPDCQVLVVELVGEVVLIAESGELLFFRLEHFAQWAAVLAQIVAVAICAQGVHHWDDALWRQRRQVTAALCVDGMAAVPSDDEEFGHVLLPSFSVSWHYSPI